MQSHPNALTTRHSPGGNMENHLLTHARLEADRLKMKVARHLESRESAARMLDSFVRGLNSVAALLGIEAGFKNQLDRYVHDLDPLFDLHREARDSTAATLTRALPLSAGTIPSTANEQFFIDGVSVERRRTPRL